MNNIIIREPTLEDADAFVAAMLLSQSLHYPWVKSPQTLQEFSDYFQRFQQPNQTGFFNRSGRFCYWQKIPKISGL